MTDAVKLQKGISVLCEEIAHQDLALALDSMKSLVPEQSK